MTDRVRSTRWAAALVLGPVAAALFTVTTAWATSHTPASTQDTTSSPSAPADPAADIQQTLSDDTVRVMELEQLVASLRAQAATIGPTVPPAGRPAGAAAAQAPAPVAVRPPAVRRTAQPPAVHTVTGASSAKAAP